MGGLCGSDNKAHQQRNLRPVESGNNYANNNNNFNNRGMINQQINQAYGSWNQQIDPVLRRRGQRYLIRQVKHEQYAGNIPGGKMPIKLLFSLDRNAYFNSNINPTEISYSISISEINNPKSFKNISNVSELDTTDFTYSNQIITEYFFEIDQQMKIQVFYRGRQIQENFISTAKINGSLNHTEEIPLLISGNSSQPDFKLIIVSDPIAEEFSRVAVSLEMRLESNSRDEYFAVFENTYKNKEQKIFKTEEFVGPYPKIIARDIALGDLAFNKAQDQDFNIEFYSVRAGNPNDISKFGELSYNLKIVDNMSHDIKGPNGSVIGKVTINTSKRNIKRFIDYIYDGMQISMICAVDFTASNREPSDPRSLHYTGSPEPNQYQQALSASASIVAYYDSDKKFPVYGFGGEINDVTSHCFNMNFLNDPEVDGVKGILACYNNAIRNVTLSGPTNFSPVIYKTIQDVQNKGINKCYYILLIITDGQISDFPETRKAIVEASVLPISIIIVGVGNADFRSMNDLDGDEQPLMDNSGKRIRDIVQFIKYDVRYATNPALFSQDLLFEIPAQVEGYYRSIGQ